MKNQLRTRARRLALDVNGAIYTSLSLVLVSLMFMLIVPLLKQPIPLHELAKLKTNTATIEPIIISIKKNGAYHLNTDMQPEETMTLNAIKKLLSKQFSILDPQQISLCIKADPAVPYGQVAKIIDWAQTLGVQHVGLLKIDVRSS